MSIYSAPQVTWLFVSATKSQKSKFAAVPLWRDTSETSTCAICSGLWRWVHLASRVWKSRWWQSSMSSGCWYSAMTVTAETYSASSAKADSLTVRDSREASSCRSSSEDSWEFGPSRMTPLCPSTSVTRKSSKSRILLSVFFCQTQ